MQATRHRGRHGRAKHTGAAAFCAQWTLNVADDVGLPRCERRGACPDVNPRKPDSPVVYVNTEQQEGHRDEAPTNTNEPRIRRSEEEKEEDES
ncbi:hypothetical protein EVAR_77555_1 [Eumeta japonica]|uniref:Uncharacterized protein n=1 Tax=Eumeta variegata TaxID=151549 RepID=A0A4C1T6U8_EUMVA|nr:hypothetical protein EVAR_77555_1 [Eumeta japonica]